MNSDLFAKPGTFEFEIEGGYPRWDSQPAADRTEGWIRHMCYELRHQTRPLKEKRMSQTQVSPNPIKGAAAVTEPSTPPLSQSEYGLMARLLDSWSAPLPIFAGNPSVPTDNMIPRRVVVDDQELLDKTSHVRGKKEPMGSFYSRTGLGKSQILAMSKSEIKRFCEIAAANAMDEPDRRYFEPKTTPNKIRIVL